LIDDEILARQRKHVDRALMAGYADLARGVHISSDAACRHEGGGYEDP
jgi:hypothetical protein